MALIKCPECGCEMSDKSDKCVRCGYPIYLMMFQNKEKKKCSYCGFENSYYNTECEKCGATLEETNNETVVDSRNETIVTSANVEVKKKKVVDGLVILLFFVMYPAAIWLIAHRKNELDSDWFTIVSLIAFYPMGLFSMWYYKKFNKTARIVITAIIAVLMIGTQLGQ